MLKWQGAELYALCIGPLSILLYTEEKNKRVYQTRHSRTFNDYLFPIVVQFS